LPRPWNAYGPVRGLKAPPRRSFTPAFARGFAAASICSSDSTEHGPANIASSLPPISTSLTLMIVGSGFVSRLTSLYGWTTRITFQTPGMDSSLPMLMSRSSPITAITVRSTPTSGTGCNPFSSSILMIFATFPCSAPLSITIIMFLDVIELIGVSRASKGYVDCWFLCFLHCSRLFHFFGVII